MGNQNSQGQDYVYAQAASTAAPANDLKVDLKVTPPPCADSAVQKLIDLSMSIDHQLTQTTSKAELAHLGLCLSKHVRSISQKMTEGGSERAAGAQDELIELSAAHLSASTDVLIKSFESIAKILEQGDVEKAEVLTEDSGWTSQVSEDNTVCSEDRADPERTISLTPDGSGLTDDAMFRRAVHPDILSRFFVFGMQFDSMGAAFRYSVLRLMVDPSFLEDLGGLFDRIEMLQKFARRSDGQRLAAGLLTVSLLNRIKPFQIVKPVRDRTALASQVRYVTLGTDHCLTAGYTATDLLKGVTTGAGQDLFGEAVTKIAKLGQQDYDDLLKSVSAALNEYQQSRSQTIIPRLPPLKRPGPPGTLRYLVLRDWKVLPNAMVTGMHGTFAWNGNTFTPKMAKEQFLLFHTNPNGAERRKLEAVFLFFGPLNFTQGITQFATDMESFVSEVKDYTEDASVLVFNSPPMLMAPGHVPMSGYRMDPSEATHQLEGTCYSNDKLREWYQGSPYPGGKDKVFLVDMFSYFVRQLAKEPWEGRPPATDYFNHLLQTPYARVESVLKTLAEHYPMLSFRLR